MNDHYHTEVYSHELKNSHELEDSRELAFNYGLGESNSLQTQRELEQDPA